MKPKILFFITKSAWGGAQKYVFDLATNSTLQEKYLPIVALGGTGTLTDELKKNNVEIIRSRYLKNSLNPITLIFSIIENIQIIRTVKPEIVHTNSSFAGLSIGVACFILRQKNIFTVHGWPQNENRNFFVKVILGQAMAFVLLLHDKYICVSKKVFMQSPNFLGVFGLKNKGSVIYNGIKVAFDFKNFNEVKILDKQVVNIVTIAELHSNKNYPLVLSALEKLPQDLKWNYHIIGDSNNSDNSEKQKLHKQIIAHKYSDIIFMHGHLKDASKYLLDFDIFVIGSITEALCFVLLEAGSAKLPCIATRVGGIPEIIDDKENGILVESNNSHQMAQALEKLIRDKDLRKEYGEKLFTTVLNKFGKIEMVEKTIAQYEKL